jgi:hypothetical protein
VRRAVHRAPCTALSTWHAAPHKEPGSRNPERRCYNLFVPRVSDQLAFATALLISGLAIAITIRTNTYVAWGTDSSAYLDAAAQWADGDLFHPTSFQFWAPWSLDGEAEAPFGRRPGGIPGTIVNVYPPGYALLLAPAFAAGGDLAAHLVAPLFLGLLAWCAYLLASELGTRWAGVGASLLVATTPVVIAHVLMPMSDAPATALWALAWVMALRPGAGAALAAGCAVAMAVLVRPNLAPLGLAIAFTLLAARWRSGDRTVVRLLTFGMASAVGPAILLWSQAALYGSAFTSGYRGAENFFRMERVPTNAIHYPAMLLDLYGWLVFAGLALVPFAFRLKPSRDGAAQPWVVIAGALAILLINYAVLLPYLTFEGWYWLRFLLPGLLALFVLLGAAVDHLRQLIAARSQLLQIVAIVPLVLVVREPRRELFATFENLEGFPRVSMMGRYLREALPPNAVILTYLQSGAAAYYTGLPIVRLDALGPEWLDRLIDDLWDAGRRPVFLIDDAMESNSFRDRYVNSRYRPLDWPPRAEFWSGTPMLYMDPADRDLFLNGETYPIDILKTPIERTYPPSSAAAAVMPQGLTMPRTHEAAAFHRALDAAYRDRLGRSAGETSVNAADASRYTVRYLRYRVYTCSHDEAVARTFAQIDRQEVAPVCGRIADVTFPSRDQVVDFRRRLEAKYRDERKARPSPTHVDLEGEAIWTQEYLRYRLSGCATNDATTRVLDQIAGKPAPPLCDAGAAATR